MERPRWRAYLLLARVSNLPTVWTNVLAGLAIARAPLALPTVAGLAAAVSLLYTAGMFLNDAFDRDFDAKFRPERPIPAGDVTGAEVFLGGWTLLVAGEAVLAARTSHPSALVWGVMLAAAIVFYDYRHKRNPLGPAIMGLCRGLVYCVAAAAVVGTVALPVIAAALLLTGYVMSLTWVARRAGAEGRWLVPLLVAGISLFDAGVIISSGAPSALVLVAVIGFVLTLGFQKVVPGT